jgi:hypothetical protein
MDKPPPSCLLDSKHNPVTSFSLFNCNHIPALQDVTFSRSQVLPKSARSAYSLDADHSLFFYTGILRKAVEVPEERDHYAFLHQKELDAQKGQNVDYSLSDVAEDFQKQGICVILSFGGYFHGAFFKSENPFLSKGFRRYVTRKGQGSKQSKHKNKNASRKVRSAGGRLRTFNEEKQKNEILEVLELWKERLIKVSAIWVAAPGNNMDIFKKNLDPETLEKVRSIPLTCRRPTLAECVRVAAILATVEVADPQREEEEEEEEEEMPQRDYEDFSDLEEEEEEEEEEEDYDNY